ncbi:plasmid pRiA4b ORF-3 family protein [Virgibacillus halophilus]|uniref:Plasmid pRiA4b ORF-3 family protein n=1 Tax=Tigheibacillus halophilus TaxID=361280 RepID=A0ABU5C1T4_9BACI|nr:plasmid pRiA4b ORF-3 family protein [Virgibacillus halophilus]
MIYELRVNLRHTNEVVWRKIEIDSNMTFNELSEILQTIFDWDGFRMHRFDISKSYGKRMKNVTVRPTLSTNYNKMPVKKNNDDLDERVVKISDWLGNVKDRALYSYNIENEHENEIVWEHEIVVEKIMHPEKGVLYPYCTGARNFVPKRSVSRELTEEQLTKTLAEAKELVKDINETLQERLSHVISEVPDHGNHLWAQLLKRTKDYYRAAPWETLAKNDVFTVVDPVTDECLFCSVLGSGQEPYGLAVYIGKQGLAAMKEHMQNGADSFGENPYPHCLMLLFDDRQMLSQQDHALIKTNDIPFRGKKSVAKIQELYVGAINRTSSGRRSKAVACCSGTSNPYL